jgi:hypothetical protein
LKIHGQLGHDIDSHSMPNVKSFRRFLPRLAIRSLLALTLMVVSLRDYLFGNGLFVYRDWSWPLSTSILPFSVFSPGILRNSGPDPLGFTRMFLNWPILLIDELTSNPITAEKIFIIYLCSVLILLSFVLAEILLRLNNKFSRQPLPKWKAEIFVLFVVLFSFTNLWTLQQFSDMYYTYIYGLLITGIALGTIILRDADWRSIILSGVLVSTIIFLAPEIYPFSWLVVAVTTVVVIASSFPLYQVIRTALGKILILFAVNLPAVATTLYVFSVTLGTGLRPLNNGSSLPSLWPQDALRLLGYGWSLITYATPSAAAAGTVSNLPAAGAPPYLVTTTGVVSIIWLLSTYFVPVIAFSSLLFRRFRTITVPTVTAAIVGLLMAETAIFPIPHLIALALQGEPTLGGAAATILAIPDHALITLASAYVILVPNVFYQLLHSWSKIQLPTLTIKRQLIGLPSISLKRPKIGQIAKTALLAGFFMFLILPGWQFFSGSFFPAGYTLGIPGNGVPDTGTFSPVQPPPGMVEVYDWLQSRQGAYNTYWPGPDGNSGYPWSQKSTPSLGYVDSPEPTIQDWVLNPTPFPSALKNLVQSNLTMDIAPYLDALNVKYLVVQPLSDAAMSSVWGIADLPTLTRLLENTPGVSLAYANGSVSVFEVNNTWGNSYVPSLVLSYPTGDYAYGVAYAVMNSTGNQLALTDPGKASNLCFGSLSCPVAIESPGYLATTLMNATSLDTLDDSTISSTAITISPGTVRSLQSPWTLWSLANWGPGQSVESMDSGAMRWTAGPGATLMSLSYNGTVTTGNPGGITIPSGIIESAQVSFLYRTSDTFSQGVQITLPALNDQQQFFASSSSGIFPASKSWSEANFTTTLPAASRDFTARIQADISAGWVELKDVRVRTAFLEQSQTSFFGSLVPPNTRPQEMTLPSGNIYIQYSGNGAITCNGQETPLTSPNHLSWIQVPTCSDGKILLTGVSLDATILSKEPLPTTDPDVRTIEGGASITLNAPDSVVVARTFASGYTLSGTASNYHPTRTLDGMMLFQDVQPGSYSLTFTPATIALTAYSATLTFSALMILPLPRIIKSRRRARRQKSKSIPVTQDLKEEPITG